MHPLVTKILKFPGQNIIIRSCWQFLPMEDGSSPVQEAVRVKKINTEFKLSLETIYQSHKTGKESFSSSDIPPAMKLNCILCIS